MTTSSRIFLKSCLWGGMLCLLASCGQDNTSSEDLPREHTDPSPPAKVEVVKSPAYWLEVSQTAIRAHDLESLRAHCKGMKESSLLQTSGHVLLSLAVQLQWDAGFDLLIQQGATRATPGSDTEGQTALAWALAHERQDWVEILLEAGANPDTLIRTPVSSEFLAQVNVESFHYYLKRETGVTPLMLAAVTAQTDAVRSLLRAGADKFAQTGKHKTTAIWLAGTGRHVTTIQLLLGKDPEHTNITQLKVKVDLSEQTVRLHDTQNTEKSSVFESVISSGASGFETPTGRYVVTNKHEEWFSSLYDDAPMPFFMRLNCGAIGLHAGDIPGYPASHGCIRLPIENAQKLFSLVPVGTEVQIVE